MTLPDISIPDIQQADIKSCHTAAGNVMYYAKRCADEVLLIEDIPRGHAEMCNSISPAQECAITWMNNTGPSIIQGISHSVTDFNLTFQLLGNFFQNTIKEISVQDNIPLSSQRRYIDGLLGDLINTITVQQKRIILLRQQVNAIAVQMTDCYNDLSAGLQTIGSENEHIQQVMKRIKLCTANEHSRENVLQPVNRLNTEPALFNTVFVCVMLEQMIAGVRAAQRSIQAIVDSWTAFKKKYTVIIAELDDAGDKEYINYLNCLDMEIARRQWQKLSDGVSVLINDDV